jgi:hypothetical protein
MTCYRTSSVALIIIIITYGRVIDITGKGKDKAIPLTRREGP